MPPARPEARKKGLRHWFRGIVSRCWRPIRWRGSISRSIAARRGMNALSLRRVMGCGLSCGWGSSAESIVLLAAPTPAPPIKGRETMAFAATLLHEGGAWAGEWDVAASGGDGEAWAERGVHGDFGRRGGGEDRRVGRARTRDGNAGADA